MATTLNLKTVTPQAVTAGDVAVAARGDDLVRVQLDTAAGQPAAAFATAVQGARADTAVQPGDLGTAAALDAGTGAGDLVQLDGSGRLPAVDGSQLTGLGSGGTVTSVDVAGTGGISSSGGPVTSSGTITVTIADGALALGKIADIATGHFLGRVAAGSGPVAALSASQVRTELNVADGATANTAATTADFLAGTDPAKHLVPSVVAGAHAYQTISIASGSITPPGGERINWRCVVNAGAEIELPTAALEGVVYRLLIEQDGTGGRAVTIDAGYLIPDDETPADDILTGAGDRTEMLIEKLPGGGVSISVGRRWSA